MARRKFGDVIILLPGITGSVLERNGKDVWAISPQAAISALFSLGNNIKDLQIRGKDDPAKDDLGDGVTAPRLVQDIHLIPGFWQIDGYTQIKQRLFAELTLEEGKNWFDYPYDWRRDNRVHGRQLGERAPRWLDAWKRSSGNADARIVLLAHSMGGLVAREFLERHDGWKITRHLVSFGTPYRGSINAITTLVNGVEKGIGPLSVDLSSLLRSFPSMYQLLPIYPSVTVDGALKRPAETSLPGVDKALATDALKFHRDIEAAVTRNQANAAYQRDGYRITPIVGIFQNTDQSARLAGDKVTMAASLAGEDMGGDGTVPRVSATPIELSDDPRETYVSTKHGSLQNAEAVLSHVVGALTRKRLATFRDTPFNGFTLEAPTVLTPARELNIVATTQGPPESVRVTVTDVANGRALRRRSLRRRRDGSFQLTVPPLSEGVYRITVASADDAIPMTPVSDLVAVIDPKHEDRRRTAPRSSRRRSTTSSTATGYSLHIGLNSVDPSGYSGWDGKLKACENDARDMAAIAASLGYQPTILLTKQATAQQVVEAITKVAGVMKEGDVFWLTYSGHGGQVPDRNGDEAVADTGEIGETADSYDETWVLYDRMLVDDELWALWATFPLKSRIVMFSDSCHSGTVAKATLEPGTASSRRPAVANRRIPFDVEERTYAEHRRTYDRIQKSVPPRSDADVKATIQLVSGCQDNQESLDGRVNGLFTEKVLATWQDGKFKGSIKQLRDAVGKTMPDTQTPNYYVVGPTNRSFVASQALSI